MTNLAGGSWGGDFPVEEDFQEAEDSQEEEDIQEEEEYHLEDCPAEAGDCCHYPCHKPTRESW